MPVANALGHSAAGVGESQRAVFFVMQEAFIGDFLATWPNQEEPCIGDFNGDDMVDGGDLGLMVAGWGTADYDLTGDGLTDGADLGLMLGDWTVL